LKQIVDYTDSKGWNKYMLLFPWAETPSVLDGNPKDYVENINNFYEAIDEDIWNRFFVLGEHFPSDYTSSIDGLFDLFQFHKGSMIGMGRGRLNELQNQGYEFGLGVPDQPMVDMPIRKYREAGWLMWDYDLIGFRYDGWTQPQYKSYDGSSIWENPMGSYFFRLNGEMTFTYPGFEIDYIVPVEQSGPVTTIRFELLRESLEDYEYFWMLQDLIVKARDKGIDIGDAENSLGRINEMIEENSMELIDDMNLLYEIRSQVADEIENLLNQMPEEKKEPEKEKCSVSKCDPGCLNPVIIFEDGCEKCICKESLKKFSWGFFGRISLIFWIVLVFVIVGMVTYFILRKRKLSQIREYQELS